MKLLPQAFDNTFQARNINHSYGSIATRTNSDFPSQILPNMYNEAINAVQGALAQVSNHLKHSKLVSKSLFSKLRAHVLIAPINSSPS